MLLGGDHERERFALDPTRDADSNRAYAGFELESQTRLSGRAVGGVRFYRPLVESRGSDIHEPYVDADLVYKFGPRTQISAHASRDLEPSAFDPVSGAPVLKYDVYELYDLETDPSELRNLSGRPEAAQVERELRLALAEKMLLDFDYLPLPEVGPGGQPPRQRRNPGGGQAGCAPR